MFNLFTPIYNVCVGEREYPGARVQYVFSLGVNFLLNLFNTVRSDHSLDWCVESQTNFIKSILLNVTELPMVIPD